MTTPRRPWRRIAAWMIDCGLILLYAGALALVCVPLYRGGVIPELPLALANLVAALALVVPAVLVLAGLDAGPRAATIGKRAMRLRLIAADGGRIAFPRALLRNAFKFGLLWLIAHAAVYGLWGGSVSGAVRAWAWPLLAAAYAIPIAWIMSLFIGTGRTPYDRLTRTSVVEAGHC